MHWWSSWKGIRRSKTSQTQKMRRPEMNYIMLYSHAWNNGLPGNGGATVATNEKESDVRFCFLDYDHDCDCSKKLSLKPRARSAVVLFKWWEFLGRIIMPNKETVSCCSAYKIISMLHFHRIENEIDGNGTGGRDITKIYEENIYLSKCQWFQVRIRRLRWIDALSNVICNREKSK